MAPRMGVNTIQLRRWPVSAGGAAVVGRRGRRGPHAHDEEREQPGHHGDGPAHVPAVLPGDERRDDGGGHDRHRVVEEEGREEPCGRQRGAARRAARARTGPGRRASQRVQCRRWPSVCLQREDVGSSGRATWMVFVLTNPNEFCTSRLTSWILPGGDVQLQRRVGAEVRLLGSCRRRRRPSGTRIRSPGAAVTT